MKLLPEGRYNNEAPVPSPDGSQVAFLSTRDDNVEIYVMNADGSGLRRLTNSMEEDKHIAWSPDGSKIAFVTYDKTTHSGNIYVMDADGSNKRALTESEAWNGLPQFSPKGTQLLFQSNRGGRWDHYVMNVDGSGVRNVTNDEAQDILPSWTPDGRIRFKKRENDTFVPYAIRPDGTDLQPYPDFNPSEAVSPDGAYVIFGEANDEDRNADLHLKDHAGRRVAQLTNTPGFDNREVKWTPDGRAFYFVSDRDGQREIYVYTLATHEQRRLTFQ